jgi:hypothetical protein
MNSDKVETFIKLAGQTVADKFDIQDEAKRRLGAQLLLSEVLEYVIKGLGVTPVVNGQEITDANNLEYKNHSDANKLEMLDGLADVAYTMYWNAITFGIPLEKAYDLVCDNNLEKFVSLNVASSVGSLSNDKWHCEQGVTWPSEVVSVEVIKVSDKYYAVGKDKSGKVRKPSSYKSVNLEKLLD